VDLDKARTDLARASAAGTNLNAARAVLIDFGTEAFGLPRSGARSLADIVRIAADAPPSRTRRAFAVLLVQALGIEGLLPNRGDAADATRSFIERALLNALRRAGYPFDGSTYDKRRFLAGLHATIDEHLRPLEPTMPRWLQGIVPPDED
jgi:hypothetical protein